MAFGGSCRSIQHLALVVLLSAWAPHLLAAAGQPVETIDDLVNQYDHIFSPSGNRNAASHLWASYILAEAPSLSKATLETLFRGFCPVSGSPLLDDPATRYSSSLHHLDGTAIPGVTHHCCWPCICDLQESVRVDTADVRTAEGVEKYHFLVIGDPCKNEQRLDDEFGDMGQTSSLRAAAPEVRCEDGKLKGAVFSDNGHPIIGMYFTDAAEVDEVSADPESQAVHYDDMCLERQKEGYNSGMGLIFHLVAAITPLDGGSALGAQGASLLSNRTFSAHVHAASGAIRGARLAG